MHKAVHENLLKDSYTQYKKEQLLEFGECYSFEEVLEFCGLKTVCEYTIRKWMISLGCSYDEQKSCYFTDKHEYPENKEDRIKHSYGYFVLEIDTYRWIQIPEESINRLRALYRKEEKYFPFDTAYKYTTEGINMYEYHVDVVEDEMLDEYVLVENKCYGGNRSFRTKSIKPKMIHGHDEVAIHQFCFQKKCWYVNGAARLLPKSNGASIMASGFMCRETGLGMSNGDLLTDEIVDKVNKSREGKQYNNSAAAKIVFGKTQKDKINDNPFLRFFEFGANKDGYWNGSHFNMQVEDMIDCLEVMYPNFDHHIVADQSSGHTRKRIGGCDITKMNTGYGGAQPAITNSVVCCEDYGSNNIEGRHDFALDIVIVSLN